MKNFTPLDKMSKKQKKEYYNRFRGTWDMNPVTRLEDRGYKRNRKKVDIDE